MVAVHVFAEGGPAAPAADRKGFRLRLQRAFVAVFEGAAPGLDIVVEACGPRWRARDRFAEHIEETGWNLLNLEHHAAATAPYPLLLVDSETPVTAVDPWAHLAGGNDKWAQPVAATAEQAQLMVQVMESWFVVDQAALAAYFGVGFDLSKFSKVAPALANTGSIEAVSKATVLSELKFATRNAHAGVYKDETKSEHSPDLLKMVDLAGKVAPVSAWAQRLVDHLRLLAATP